MYLPNIYNCIFVYPLYFYKVKSNTGESLSKLQLYDEIKCRMETTKNALEEADNWTKLITDIEMVNILKIYIYIFILMIWNRIYIVNCFIIFFS